jgi:hypothetical protein
MKNWAIYLTSKWFHTKCILTVAFFRCLFYFFFSFVFGRSLFFLPGENIKKVMYRSVSFCVQRQISSLRMLNSACSLSASYVTTFYFFAIYSPVLAGHWCYEFTHHRHAFFSVICSNFYLTTYQKCVVNKIYLKLRD